MLDSQPDDVKKSPSELVETLGEAIQQGLSRSKLLYDGAGALIMVFSLCFSRDSHLCQDAPKSTDPYH